MEDLDVGEKLILMRMLNKECGSVEWPLASGLVDTCEHAGEHYGAMRSDKCFDHQFLKKDSASWASVIQGDQKGTVHLPVG